MDAEERGLKAERKVYQVGELTRLIRQLLEGSFNTVWVEGEISNFRRQASGHCYFTLKDASAQLRAVLFRGNQRDLKFSPGDGMIVRIQGEISVYEARGEYQVLVRRMEAGGKGALQAQFEALKEKLQKEGLFDPAKKRPLPLLPRHVGVVTSPTGAAIRDILNVVARRFPNLHVVVAPCRVQGEGAAQEIAAAIDLLNARGGLDVLIVGRGGGSLEDLWAFNEEPVARAIARSGIPVISAVGHEVDFTISDFVADLRAPTPSAAAELVVGRKDEFVGQLRVLRQQLVRTLRERVLSDRNRLLSVRGSRAFREPAALIRQYAQRVDGLILRAHHALRSAGSRDRSRCERLGVRTLHALQLRQGAWRQDVRRVESQLRVLNPLAVLARGYSVTLDANQRVVRDVRDVRKGDRLTTRVAGGRIDSEVTGTEEQR